MPRIGIAATVWASLLAAATADAPASGQDAARQGVVEVVTFDAGRSPTERDAQPPQRLVLVPKVTDLRFEAAQTALHEVNLFPVPRKAPSTYIVTEQHPEAGSRVPPASSVSVVTKPSTTVPMLMDAAVAQAEKRAGEAGLKMEFAGPAQGVVIRQDPDAGTLVARGTGVFVELGRQSPPGPFDGGGHEASQADSAPPAPQDGSRAEPPERNEPVGEHAGGPSAPGCSGPDVATGAAFFGIIAIATVVLGTLARIGIKRPAAVSLRSVAKPFVVDDPGRCRVEFWLGVEARTLGPLRPAKDWEGIS